MEDEEHASMGASHPWGMEVQLPNLVHSACISYSHMPSHASHLVSHPGTKGPRDPTPASAPQSVPTVYAAATVHTTSPALPITRTTTPATGGAISNAVAMPKRGEGSE